LVLQIYITTVLGLHKEEESFWRVQLPKQFRATMHLFLGRLLLEYGQEALRCESARLLRELRGAVGNLQVKRCNLMLVCIGFEEFFETEHAGLFRLVSGKPGPLK
jgi:hypothetical protein